MNNATLRAAVIQQQAWPDKSRSLAETERLLQQVCQNSQPDLVLLQELHTTHYFCQTEDTSVFDLAEPLDGPSAARLSALARANRCVLVGGIFEKRAKGVFHNTALVFDRDGSLCGTYRKMHIPDDPAFYEKFYFTPGDAVTLEGASGFTPVQTSVGKLGVLICWDQWYPEAARLMALAGADVAYVQRWIGSRQCGPSDGTYGPNTAAGVRWYQRIRNLAVDGRVGPQTWRNMGVRWAG